MSYVLCKYRGKWAVFDRNAHVYYFVGSGKKYCEKRLKELQGKG